MLHQCLKVIRYLLPNGTVVVREMQESAIQDVRIITQDIHVIMAKSCAHGRIINFARIEWINQIRI